jgi:hypothetical protein
MYNQTNHPDTHELLNTVHKRRNIFEGKGRASKNNIDMENQEL